MLNKINFQIASLLPSDTSDLPTKIAGLWVGPGCTVETDGHQLVMVTAPEVQRTLFDPPDGIDPAEEWTPFLLDRTSAMTLAKIMPKPDADNPGVDIAVIDASTENGETAMLAVDERVRQEIIKAKKMSAEEFPDVARVIPPADSARFTIALNPDVLVPVMKLFQSFCGQPTVTIRLYDAAKGVRIDAECDGQVMTAVVMPQRQTETPE